jgi:hypothetical protein
MPLESEFYSKGQLQSEMKALDQMIDFNNSPKKMDSLAKFMLIPSERIEHYILDCLENPIMQMSKNKMIYL